MCWPFLAFFQAEGTSPGSLDRLHVHRSCRPLSPGCLPVLSLLSAVSRPPWQRMTATPRTFPVVLFFVPSDLHRGGFMRGAFNDLSLCTSCPDFSRSLLLTLLDIPLSSWRFPSILFSNFSNNFSCLFSLFSLFSFSSSPPPSSLFLPFLPRQVLRPGLRRRPRRLHKGRRVLPRRLRVLHQDRNGDDLRGDHDRFDCELRAGY